MGRDEWDGTIVAIAGDVISEGIRRAARACSDERRLRREKRASTC
jgi:hypothetical protein